MQEIDNGHADIAEVIQATTMAGLDRPKTVALPPATLRRLARLHARAEGAAEVASLAANVAQAKQAELERELMDACSEEGLTLIGGSNAPIDIDWRNGTVTAGVAPAPVPS